ncbi:MAG: C39 family peptidase [Planctomycetaceae bacterium]|nr:C39 family peptidase [Planctomycetaceae bacterium]
MSYRRLGPVVILLVGIAAQGCAYRGTARDFDPAELKTETGWVSVPHVSPQRQDAREDCGIAALGMVLRHYDREVPPAQIEKACPIEPGAGSRAGDMRDFAKRHGLDAYLIHGELSDFSKELSRGHPVIVGLVKQYSSGPLTHYEVVVALHPDRKEIVTLDPANGWRSNTLEGFQQEWDAAARLALVIFPPGESPP